MNLAHFIAQFSYNVETSRSMVQGVTLEQARWKPNPTSWSILEVINHLYDEEREDFRRRLDLTLHHPTQEWPAIDPQGWVTNRQYNQRELNSSLANFLDERQKSINWLKSLENPNWQSAHSHPHFGSFSAADMLAAWLAHDFLHIRQLTELHYAYHAEQMHQYRIGYAGDW
jgi:hypothetical protein